MSLSLAWVLTENEFIFLVSFSSTVSAEILKSSLTTMERHIVRLENDIENFPKMDDQQDKFVEKMSISFFAACIRAHKFAPQKAYVL